MTLNEERRRDQLAAAAALYPDEPAAEVARLLETYFRHVLIDDLTQRPPDDLLGAFLNHRSTAAVRSPGEIIVKVFTPRIEEHGWATGNTVIQIVTDDTPFVVDSVTAELGRELHDIRLMVHPQMPVVRDSAHRLVAIGAEEEPTTTEAWVYFEIALVSSSDELQQIAKQLRRVLSDVKAAVADWVPMIERASSLAAHVRTADLPLPADEVDEVASLLEWMSAGNFVMLGYCHYRVIYERDAIGLQPVDGTGLGLLRKKSSTQRRMLSGPVAQKALEKRLLVITKANSRSTVHRSAYLDYVGIKSFDENGLVDGEHRFLGLFTSTAHHASVTTVPFLAAKAERTLELTGYATASHSAKDVLDILETYPREELFQTDPVFLAEVANRAVASRYHRQLQLFVRRDDYERFTSCLVYLPRDQYNTSVRSRIQSVLMKALGGVVADYTARVSDSPRAMVHFVIRTKPGTPPPEVDVHELESWLRTAIRTWSGDWREAMLTEFGEQEGARLIVRWESGFDDAYRAAYQPRVAASDVRQLEQLGSSMAAQIYQPRGAADGERRLKLFSATPIGLTQVLPILLNFGLHVTDERPYLVRSDDQQTWQILDFGVRAPKEQYWGDEHDDRAGRFLEALNAVWNKTAQSDPFNQLGGSVGLSWTQIISLRVLATYLKQTTHYSTLYLEAALTENPEIAALLVEGFETRFNPDIFINDADARASAEAEIASQVLERLKGVPSLDHDRIIRCYLQVLRATLRTNFYQIQWTPDPAEPLTPVALKLDPRRVSHLPEPRPMFEIWVYSPRVEGVHLRFGMVARGGLRWSDRPEDFRTEVLGLVKAQMVKNSVIVPTGAKGGFYPKHLPDPTLDRAAWLTEGAEAYRSFITALLAITDNLVDGQVEAPHRVIRHDSDDTYLVVAADKGTAHFSDLANTVSRENGFWLDDAFASGGSTGYDHKAMGITARGAWESVRRHFLELGVNVKTDEISVVGIGDMSGDVFGNGMLLSEHLRLIGAFDHRHVFIDPDPVPATAFAERKRLFDLPVSSWADYSSELISEGGGVFSRSAKAIPVSAQMRDLFDLGSIEQITPNELISALLRARVDLLWNGGIGTYIKATDERNAQIGDRANDPVRINGSELRCRVVGEGGNLGVSQRGRIEAALAGIKINTDAIDNSAGVESSDHEVNLKILLSHPLRVGDLTQRQRNDLLRSMTDDVAARVLRTNYEQNVLLSNARQLGRDMLGVHERLMEWLEDQGLLNRVLEALPDEATLRRRAQDGRGLTSPEFSVLVAFVKLVLKQEVLASALPDDPWFKTTLRDYFPEPVHGFEAALASHPLRREIITNQLANSLVNRGGITFAHRALEETGASLPEIAKAFIGCREIFDLADFAGQIEAVDAVIPAASQSDLYVEFRRLLDHSVRALLGARGELEEISELIQRYQPAVRKLRPMLGSLLVGEKQQLYRKDYEHYVDCGVPEKLARTSAGLVYCVELLQIVDLAAHLGIDLNVAAEAYFQVADLVQAETLLGMLAQLPHQTRWDARARSSLRSDLHRAVSTITAAVLRGSDEQLPTEVRVAAWAQTCSDRIAVIHATTAELSSAGSVSLGAIWIVIRDLQSLVPMI